MLLFLYRTIIFLGWPFYRKNKGKEDAVRFNERLGINDWPRPRGELIWIHAASVGESLSIIPLLKKLDQDFEEVTILVTTGTVTSANLIKSKLPAGIIHQYIPIDARCSVKKFINHWQPNLAIFTESELWPNLIDITSKTCPMILLNARISDNSFKNWSILSSLANSMLNKFSLLLPQSRIDQERLEALGANNICFLGNLKYSSPPLPVSEEQLEILKAMIGQRKILVAASTHKNEEEQFARIHLELKKYFPSLLTIIVPRHTTRSIEIESSFKEVGVNYSVRSDNGIITDQTDIYLADTMGELGMFYSLADIAFIGGSLIPQGGHNPIEAAHFNCAIIMGEFIFNFREITNEFISHNAMIVTKGEEELISTLKRLLKNDEERLLIANNARNFVSEANNILDQVVEKIGGFLSKK
jgi:3-deoxy-D-manno-octulosonic-acid transferase